MSTHGLCNVHKEAGWTSQDVVAKLRGIFGQKKIGHTGTLDPDATGVLVVALGNATKLTETLTDHEKEYIATCRLGIVTDTQDLSGRVLSESDVQTDEKALRETLSRFTGEYDQIPPMYSAVKVGGRRLYSLAREGKEVGRKPRRVHIASVTLLDASGLETDHVFTMEIRCSRGTYIRTLCHDIGEALGCGGAMATLVRTRVGNFRLADARRIDEILFFKKEGRLAEIVQGADTLFGDLGRLTVRDDAHKFLDNGNPLKLSMFCETVEDDTGKEAYTADEKIRVYDEAGLFYGIFDYDIRKKLFMPKLYLPQG